MFGDNEYGQLAIEMYDERHIHQNGSVTQPTRVCSDSKFTQISLGSRHTLFLTQNSNVYGAGLNSNFELGLGSCEEGFCQPVKI